MTLNEEVISKNIKTLNLPIDGVNTFSFEAYLPDVGGIFDPLGKEGLFYLTARVMKRGSARFPLYRDVVFEEESNGAHIGIDVKKEFITFRVHAPSRNLGKSLILLEDIFHSPMIRESDFQKEKQSILSEIHALENDPVDFTSLKFREQVYNGTQFGAPIMGTRSSIESINLQDVQRAVQWIQHSKRIVLMLGDSQAIKIYHAGNSALLSSADLGNIDLTTSSRFSQNLNLVEDSPTLNIQLLKRDLEQALLFVGLHSVGVRDQDYWVAQVFTAILGSGFGSLLMANVREKHSLAYQVVAR